MLIGREAETAGLGRLLDAARGGTSGSLLLRGEAGIGKTALLDEAAAAAEGFLVLRATGIESEAELPYATLHQLLRPLEGRIDRLAEPQARALGGALGLAHEREPDRFLVGVGTLTLLADAAEEQPVLVLLDDAAWFDRESSHALGFAARRLQAEGVVLLFAVRDEPGRRLFALPGVDELRVERLGEERARELLRTSYGDGIDSARREDVVLRAAGNPLALLELARDSASAGGTEQAFAARVGALPEATRDLLLLAAADSTTSLAVVGAAAHELGLDAAALEPAETAGLVHAAHGTIAFRHPLVRSAVYHAAPFAARARAHTALAEVLDAEEDADRRAWHHAAAVLGTDDRVAAELERTADRALRRAGHAAASAALERAAELSDDGGARGRRLVDAAHEAGMAGDGDRALALLDRVSGFTDPACEAQAALIRGQVALYRTSRESFDWFLRAGSLGHAVAPPVALQAMIRAIEAFGQGRLYGRLPELQAVVDVLCASTPDERSALGVVRGFTAFAAGDFDSAFPALEEGVAESAGSTNPMTLLHAAWAAAFTSDLGQPTALAARAEGLARATGAIGALVPILTTRAVWELAAARLVPAEAAASEILVLAPETGQESLAAIGLAVLAHIDAIRGREDSCRARAAEAIAIGDARETCQPISAAGAALAALELGLGRPADALARLQTIFDEGHQAYRYTVIDDLIEAAVRAGQPDDALDPLAAWQHWVRHSGLVTGQVVIARARALLAPAEDADARFQEALALHEQAPWPFVHARTELAYGEFLRRARRKIEARVQLRSALARFEALDAAPWADRAAGELRATGETARKRDPSTLTELTPQELQIARLAAEGGRNREIAGRLFLSPKTVEYHLRKVFQKLDITSRSELARLFPVDEAPPELVVAAP